MGKIFKQTFRLWWQKPRSIDKPEENRSVSFLELFYDLVYVVIIAELTHALATHVSVMGLIQFAFLFFLVWWAWFNGSYYHEVHGNNDIRTRVFTFLQMFTVVGMAVFAHNAFGAGFQGFALSYAAFLFILTFLWWRTGVHDARHRPASRPYSFVFLLTAISFAVSAFIPEPYGLYLWIIAGGASLLLPLFMLTLGCINKPVRDLMNRNMVMRDSIIERFGLFTIIVLGEVFVALVQGVASLHDIDGITVLLAMLGMVIAVSMWWIFFDFVSHRKPKNSHLERFGWIYLHIPVTGSIAAVGAAVLNIIEHHGGTISTSVQWLLTIAVTLFLVSIILLLKTVHIAKAHKQIHRSGKMVMVISAILILSTVLLDLNGLSLLIITSLLLMLPIFTAFKLWVRRMATEQGFLQ